MTTADDRVQQALAFIAEQVVGGGYAPGGQVTCWVPGDGEPANGAIGTDACGTQLDGSSIFATYCMAKPILALAIGRLVDRCEISYDDLLGDVLPCTGAVRDVTVADLLTHEVRLGVPEAIDAMLIDQDAYRARLLSATAQRLSTPRYSEFAAWRMLGLAIEEIVGAPLAEWVVAEVLDPMGAAGDLWLGPWSESSLERLRVNAAMTKPDCYTPLLAERGRWLTWRTNPGYGGYLSTAAMCRVVGELLISASGEGTIDPTTARALVESGPLHDDEVLQRPCRFGRGVLADMRHFGLGRQVSSSSFGQVGLQGMSAAVADPARGIVAAYHLTAYSDADTMNDWLRPQILELLLGPR